MKNAAGIAALVLAAGTSSRMGALKPLLPFGRATVIEQALNCFVEAGVEDVAVIVGYRANEIMAALKHLKARWVLNPDYDRGMLSSVLAGIQSLDGNVRAFFLLPSDIPLVKAGTVRALIRAYRQLPAPVVYPVFRGARGHPPLISRACVSDLAPTHEGGMRSFLQKYKDEAVEVEVPDEGILMDCDTPADYRTMQLYASREGNLKEGES